MGDRCYVEIKIDLHQTDLLARCFGYKDAGDLDIIVKNSIAQVVFAEINYAGYAQLNKLASTNTVFTGWNSDQGSTVACIFCGIQGEFHAWPCNHERLPIIFLNGNGDPDPNDLKFAREFLKKYKHASKKLNTAKMVGFIKDQITKYESGAIEYQELLSILQNQMREAAN